jgi:hypothetical protein
MLDTLQLEHAVAGVNVLLQMKRFHDLGSSRLRLLLSNELVNDLARRPDGVQVDGGFVILKDWQMHASHLLVNAAEVFARFTQTKVLLDILDDCNFSSFINFRNISAPRNVYGKHEDEEDFEELIASEHSFEGECKDRRKEVM